MTILIEDGSIKDLLEGKVVTHATGMGMRLTPSAINCIRNIMRDELAREEAAEHAREMERGERYGCPTRDSGIDDPMLGNRSQAGTFFSKYRVGFD